MRKGELLYEGKAKRVFETDAAGVLWAEFKDSATAFDGVKKGTIKGKGVYNATMSAKLFSVLERAGILTHFLEQVEGRSLLVRRLKMFPVEIVMRNKVAGSLAERYGLGPGTELKKPILEYYLKANALHDPMMNRNHVLVLGYMTERKLSHVEGEAARVNRVLRNYMRRRGLELVDFKLEFGERGRKIYLGDEISPDTCRIWDAATGEVLDKDRFRFDLGAVEEHYEEVVRRLTA
ncbi:MAG: phosphoribosylaminoimidazolesuccinocarboxamide synthase [candidate division Zixibacteria bacterium]|nr:phosphoribosylaminoimidazolesuccinocarboxamide synthase [candidate division Zixibacteria bacterium]